MVLVVLALVAVAAVVIGGDLLGHRRPAPAGDAGFPEPSRRRRWSWLFVPLSVVTFYAGAIAAERVTILLGYDPVEENLPGWVEWVGTLVLLAVALLAPAAGIVLARRAIRIDHDAEARRPLLVNASIAIALVAVFVLLAI